MDEPLVVSGVGAVRAQVVGDGAPLIEVWNENSDEPGDEPYLTFGGPLDPEAEGPYRQQLLPRAAWTVTSGEGVLVLAATALGPKPLDPALAALDAQLAQYDADRAAEDEEG